MLVDRERSAPTWLAVIVATARLVSMETPGPPTAQTMTSAVEIHADGMHFVVMTWEVLSVSVPRDSKEMLWSNVKVSRRGHLSSIVNILISCML